ncbi:PREDICTED: F-box protein SNE [Tarenaya hassleriana]|uniref:F-box protein SNE n=1 Tax=Tarenaya hassleriana TaxID=28532 RepID=UPI00053C151E|nr:PREDICTED: F-box protein SNE [Tarenaya hassleriana]
MSEKQNTSKTKRQRLQYSAEDGDENFSFFFSINDHVDILVEILRRLDGPTLCSAACVCRLWSSVVSRDDSIWEDLCLRHVSPPPSPSLRSIVSSLGGFRRLYFLLTRLRNPSPRAAASHRLQLSLSLFSVDSYERLSVAGGGAWLGDAPSPSSLIFLRKPVNVV